MIELSKEQKKLHDDVIEWYKSPTKQVLTLGGVAGTGKTTLIGFITDTLRSIKPHLRIAYCTFTGKASVVLASKIKNFTSNDSVGTIHSLIYNPVKDEETGVIVEWVRKEFIVADLIIIDEASMVNKEIYMDLKKYGLPMLAVGDYGQLPPIGKENFSLVENPDLKLTEIHRQALDNPIIKLSMIVREEGCITEGNYGKAAAKLDYALSDVPKKILNTYDYRSDTQILCGMNKTRVKLNTMIRERNNFERAEPYPGEKLICLLNNKQAGIMNGQMGILQDCREETNMLLNMVMHMDGDKYPKYGLLTHRTAFGKVKYDVVLQDAYRPEILKGYEWYDKKPRVNVFDYGYAISVHKSQGSEFKRVILIEERNSYQSDEDYAKWLYTAVTRASQKLIIIDGFY